jgi:hypothetical protein
MSNGGVVAREELALQVINFFVRSLDNEKIPGHDTPIDDYPQEHPDEGSRSVCRSQLATPAVDGDLGGRQSTLMEQGENRHHFATLPERLWLECLCMWPPFATHLLKYFRTA